MTITAKIICDSISENGKRITSLQLRYPRFIHAEFMTHRVFSRNASSSRAVPVNKLIEDIISDTAMPIHWGKNQPGMQADEECDDKVFIPVHSGDVGPFSNKEAWFCARDRAIEVAKGFNFSGYHKQIVNRLLEPFSHINVLVTATEWDNFFTLRCHKDAQPEIKALADQMWVAKYTSVPTLLKEGEWHLPYISVGDYISVEDGAYTKQDLIKMSVARCARVSYLTHDMKQPLPENDLKLYDRLVGSVPLHASPAEHQATPDRLIEIDPRSSLVWTRPNLHGNFVGWKQYRKTLEKS